MTMELIQHIELGSAAAGIEFTSIPNDGTDLVIYASTRAVTDTSSLSRLVINGLTTNQSIRYLEGAGSGSGASGTASRIFQIDNNPSFTSNTFANVAIYIPNYASTTAAKSFSSDSVSENNATTALQWIAAGLWNSTSAITTIKIEPPSGNFAAGSSATLYKIKRFNTTLSPKATGGAISYDSVNNKWVHAFYTSGTFTPTENLTGVEYLVVAGGGGGGTDGGGGGGAGGYRSSVVGESSGGGGSAESTLSLTSGTGYTVTIGAGGAAGSGGSNSVFSSITATGGGRGAWYQTNSATSGGSGGGAAPWSGSTTTPGSGTANQGYAGGLSSANNASGGGGGAGAVGGNASGGNVGGNGGIGVQSSITGTAVYRAGGGGGGPLFNYGTAASGGLGGGANSQVTQNVAPSPGVANTGGGGGGAIGGAPGGIGSAGGSGIVIVRYSA